MTKSKATRKALWSSVVALLLCFTMLMGATFAWFTDNVSSTGNRIQAGDLEVDLIMDKLDGAGYTSIANGTGDIFNEAAGGNGFNWEPGKTEIVYLGVQNTGSLALKYNILLNIIDEGLIGSLEYAILDGVKAGEIVETDWASLKARSDAQTGDVVAGKLVAAQGGVLDEIALNNVANETDYFALAVHMKEEAGNEYEKKSVVIDIEVVATQKDAEEDSFDNTYDEDAEYTVEPDSSWYFNNPDATEYVLSSAAELAGLADVVNSGEDFDATITLSKDIDLALTDWEPIGTVDSPFAGTFDGAGHTISGLTVGGVDYAAFINYADGDSVIKDLTLENVDIESTKHAAGVVCIASSEGLTIDNVTVSGSITAAKYAAGIVHNASNVTVTNCTNNADINTNYSAAGIATWVTVNATIENCTNNGDITATDRAAGIVVNVAGTVKGCENNGNVVCTGNMPVGGIVAILSGATTIEDCTNNANVTSKGADQYNASAAGILAQTPGSAATIKSCTNNGTIIAENSFAAGIGISMYGGITATDCANTGAVTGKAGAEGVVTATGMFSGTNNVTNCTNSGVVTVG